MIDGGNAAMAYMDDEPDTGVDEVFDNPASRLHMAETVRMAEAIVFASAEPVSQKALAARLPHGSDVAAVMAELERIYEKRDRTRLGLILRGKRLGLSLAEIFELLGMYDGARNSALQLQRFLAVLAERRRVIEQQREDIVAVLGEIDRLEKQCTHLLAGQSDGVGPV